MKIGDNGNATALKLPPNKAIYAALSSTISVFSGMRIMIITTRSGPKIPAVRLFGVGRYFGFEKMYATVDN